MTRLSLKALPQLAPEVAVPRYRRDQLSPGILHVGLGNFHRAHQALYMDDLFNLGRDHDWALVGAGVRPNDDAMRRTLAAQDWLTTVVELEPGGANTARVTGAMIDFAGVASGNGPLLEAMVDPRIRIVAMTVTEGGYFVDPATGAFDADHAEIKADAAALDRPQTVFGVIVEALRRRRAAGIPPFSVMSCDNLPGNGHAAGRAVVGLATLVDPALADWIGQDVAFPNSMVDRITPATTDAQRAMLEEDFGIDDGWPVFCEPFRQWVMEDRFVAGRPAFEEVGVTFTTDVAAFEFMKLRILNGGHATIAYPAALLDIHFVHDAMADPLVAGFLNKLEREEILPVVPPVPGVSLTEYLALIERRFANPGVGDTIPRLCLDGSNRQPKFVLASTRDRVRKGWSVTGLALESALWCRYLQGETDSGAAITIDDVQAERLQVLAKRARTEPLAFLELRDIFGDLADAPAFQQAFSGALTSLWRDGTAKTLQRYLDLQPGESLG
ncbi:MAG: mannitol dehydrogenase family protein [Pseudomonadota bacterium]